MPRFDPTLIRTEVLSWQPFPERPEEGRAYAVGSLERLQQTLELLPPAPSEARLLELGAAPYFLTRLLRRHTNYQLELANFFGDDHPRHGTNVYQNSTGADEVFSFQNFNAEREAFPYSAEQFAVVLCCEILEHLTADPTHLLCEIHRVLQPEGLLLLTTPNVFNLAYSLRLLRGLGNIFHPYSGHGIYGRHQREYSPPEVADLLTGIGYHLEQTKLADIYPYRWHWRLLKRLRPWWRDNQFVLARKHGTARPYRPTWLYCHGAAHAGTSRNSSAV